MQCVMCQQVALHCITLHCIALHCIATGSVTGETATTNALLGASPLPPFLHRDRGDDDNEVDVEVFDDRDDDHDDEDDHNSDAIICHPLP